MNPDDPLLAILVCPLDKGPLHLLAPQDAVVDALVPQEALYNPRLRRRYPILDGIPQLLPSSGEPVTEDEHERLMRRISEAGRASGVEEPDDADPGGGGGASGPSTARPGIVQ